MSAAITPRSFNEFDSATQRLWEQWAEAHSLTLTDISRMEVMEAEKVIFVTLLHRNAAGKTHVGQSCDSGWTFDFDDVCVRYLLVPYHIPVHLSRSAA